MPFHRFLAPEYSDGLEAVRRSITGGPLPSARFVSLVVHGYRDEEAPITMLLAQWGQFIDHDLTATLQPRSINGSIPSCCRSTETELHPSCLPINVPRDDPTLAPLGVRCLEFLRSAPAQRRECFLSWREQTNQVTSYIDASPVYSSNPRSADSSRIQRDGLLLFGRGPPREDPCLRGGFGHQCIRAGDTRAGEQPGLLAIHTVFVAEHNRITLELTDLNPHWSDEKLYQETRRIIGAIFQHITYREFLPLVLGKEVCRLFDLELETRGFYKGYDPKVNPTVSNAFAAAAFRFGHALVQSTILRSDTNFRFLRENVSLHDENSFGDIGGIGSLHRILRGMATQRTLKRDEFMSPELTNHLFQSSPFPFGMDLAAINIQRGRDHGLPAYVEWRKPCGLQSINSWADLEEISGPKSAERLRKAYNNVEDIDLFVGGISERPVVGGLVGPVFACIIAQQFSNLRRGDRFWYENPDFESSFTSSQLFSIRQVSLSQILCRSLGSSNVMQPHAFLPPEFAGNERLRCSTGILAPINLAPWIERDPFHKEADFHILNNIQSNDDNFIPLKPIVSNFDANPTAKPISGNLDFDTETPVFLTTQTGLFLNKTVTTVDNKLDLPTTTTTTTRPRRKRTTTRRVTIDNKVDFSSTKRPESPFSKLAKESQTLSTENEPKKTVKRSTDMKRRRQRENLDELTTRQLSNHDNSTKHDDNQSIASRLDEDSFNTNDDESDNRSRIHPYESIKQQYNNDYDNDDKPLRPTYYYRPSSFFPSTTKRPTSFQNNRPNYLNSNSNKRPTSTPISDNKYSTPFSYDTYANPLGSISSLSPQINYDNMAIPLYISPNRINNKPSYQLNYNRPTYATTRKMDFSTFLIIETTRRTSTPTFNNPKRTSTYRPYLSTFLEHNYQQPSFSTQSPFNLISSSSSLDNSDDDDNDSTNFSIFFSPNTNKVSIQKPSNENLKPFYNNQNHRPSVFSYDKPDENEQEFDGYLRPETNFYIPLKNKHKPSYNDYSKYNNKLETSTASNVKYYYIKNILHKYYDGKSADGEENKEEGDEGLYDQEQMNRYAELYDEHLDDKSSNEFVSLTRTLTDQDKNDKDKDKDDIKLEGRSKNGPQNIFLVPFKVLTRVDRPDNWIDKTSNHDAKSQLPEVPLLEQDGSIVTRELPKPIRKVDGGFSINKS